MLNLLYFYCIEKTQGGIADAPVALLPLEKSLLRFSNPLTAAELVLQKNNLTYGLLKGIFRAIAL
jgi:hypothetical protein